jgi:hypothetical protein
MAQSEQKQEDQQSGYIFCTSSAGALDSNVIRQVQVQWVLDSGASEHYVKKTEDISVKKTETCRRKI